MATAAAGADRFNAAMASEGAAGGGGGDLGMAGKEMLDEIQSRDAQASAFCSFALVLGHECLQHRPQSGLGLLLRCSLAFI